jgi:hypothetical protein
MTEHSCQAAVAATVAAILVTALGGAVIWLLATLEQIYPPVAHFPPARPALYGGLDVLGEAGDAHPFEVVAWKTFPGRRLFAPTPDEPGGVRVLAGKLDARSRSEGWTPEDDYTLADYAREAGARMAERLVRAYGREVAYALLDEDNAMSKGRS